MEGAYEEDENAMDRIGRSWVQYSLRGRTEGTCEEDECQGHDRPVVVSVFLVRNNRRVLKGKEMSGV